MRKTAFRLAALVLFTAVGAVAALAQAPSIPGPYNVDIGAILTDSNNATASRTSANQSNLAYTGVMCTYVATAGSGSASVAFSIDVFDAATNSFKTLVTTNTLPVMNSGNTGLNTPLIAIVANGIGTASPPTNVTVSGLALPRVWRVTRTISGTFGPALTGKVGCNYLK